MRPPSGPDSSDQRHEPLLQMNVCFRERDSSRATRALHLLNRYHPVDPVKYRGFTQATVTGLTLGLQGFRTPCCVAQPSAPANHSRIEQATPLRRCEPLVANLEPRTSFEPLSTTARRVPSTDFTCSATPPTATRPHSAISAPRWATSAACPTRARLSILETRIDVSSAALRAVRLRLGLIPGLCNAPRQRE
jgi:hypothetical protein